MYHINSKGEVARCLAIFKDCPLEQHFESKEQGLSYVNEWDRARIENPDLANEKICEPQIGGSMQPSKFKDKNLEIITENNEVIKISQLSDDYVIVLDDSNSQENDAIVMGGSLMENKISRRYVGRAVDYLDDPNYIYDFETYYKLNTASRFKKEDDFKKSKLNLAHLYLPLIKKFGSDAAYKISGFRVKKGKINQTKVKIISQMDLFEE